MTVSPLLKRLISSGSVVQYFLINERCCFRSETVASNWDLLSSYGSLIPRLDVAAPDQPEACVARRRDEVVLAAAAAAARPHQRDHVVRGAGVLAVDLASGLTDELGGEALVRIGRPLDQVERALALADLR